MPLRHPILAAAAIKGGTVRVTGIGKKSVQGDTKFADVLEKWARASPGAMTLSSVAAVS